MPVATQPPGGVSKRVADLQKQAIEVQNQLNLAAATSKELDEENELLKDEMKGTAYGKLSRNRRRGSSVWRKVQICAVESC